jgi:hypothetical protein
MDMIVQLYETVPAAWRPYFAAALLALWIITKIRSMIKSDLLNKISNANNLTGVAKALPPKKTKMGALVDLLF